jgi:two-component system, NarL family, response regulator LiaR
MTEQARIRVLVVDDHVVIREGLCALISSRTDMEIAGEASNGEEAIQRAASTQPDVILMDLAMPRMDGVRAIEEIIRQNPSARILVLTSYTEDKQVFSAIKAGAMGYLLKDSSYKDLVRAIQQVYAGELSLSADMALKVVRELKRPAQPPHPENPLTERELEVLVWIAKGFSNHDIAEKLTTSERTIAKHVSNILSKLQLKNRTQAALYALQEKWISEKPA